MKQCKLQWRQKEAFHTAFPCKSSEQAEIILFLRYPPQLFVFTFSFLFQHLSHVCAFVAVTKCHFHCYHAPTYIKLQVSRLNHDKHLHHHHGLHFSSFPLFTLASISQIFFNFTCCVKKWWIEQQ